MGMITSSGKAKENHPDLMGRYTLVKDTVVTRIVGDEDKVTNVYKNDYGDRFLFQYINGQWCVGDTVGLKMCGLFQPNGGEFSYSPSKTLPWLYCVNETWMDNDNTLRVYPCYG